MKKERTRNKYKAQAQDWKRMTVAEEIHAKPIIQAQEKLTQEIINTNIKIQEKYPECYGFPAHEHICTFDMLSRGKRNPFIQSKECKEWIKKQPVVLPENENPYGFYDYCDYCQMMNYVAVDDLGRIVFVHRNTQEDIDSIIKISEEFNVKDDN